MVSFGTQSFQANRQGVPALFRWLSKKYPKIVQRVVEDTPTKVRQDDGSIVEIPVQYESANPNGFEVDNLYCRLTRSSRANRLQWI